MFHAACAASQRPAFSPTRGSGVGAVAETMGATGAGITAGGGGGGGGGVPRPSRPPAASPAGGVAGVPLGGAGAAAGGAADGGVAAGGVAGGGVLGAGVDTAGGVPGVVAGGDVVFPELAHAGTPNAPAANRAVASRPLISSNRIFLIVGGSPAFRSSD